MDNVNMMEANVNDPSLSASRGHMPSMDKMPERTSDFQAVLREHSALPVDVYPPDKRTSNSGKND